jgi:hypothetical protein
MLNKDTEPWNGGYALTGKRKRRMAISVFGTALLVFFGVGFSIPADVYSPAPLKLTNASQGKTHKKGGLFTSQKRGR